ncbi:MAG: DnaA regulatory inactivator Hda [Gammaproteobacteria bacterium]|nr:DnaA regulatory inactivator Hda [Gammaproteobacteria bacterium]
MTAPEQLPLGIRLDAATTFENFYPADNRDLVRVLQEGTEPLLYLWGAAGTGKSHLLQAACHAAVQRGDSVMYLPLRGDESLTPAVLEGLDNADVVCIDDVDSIARQTQWEEELFHLFNRVRDQRGRLYVTAKVSPTALEIQLSDLASRLAWGLTFQLQTLTDAQKIAALQLRAQRRGLELSGEVAGYLLKQLPRDMHHLFAMLDRLDQASLQQQRRLTIPFVKNWIKTV